MLLTVQEGTLCLPYEVVATDVMEQFVLEKVHLLEREEANQLLEELNHQHVSLSTVLESVCTRLGGNAAGEKVTPAKRYLNAVLDGIRKYTFEVGHYDVMPQPINDLSRELVRAMAEVYDGTVYLGTFESDQLTLYRGQKIHNYQYNFCVPVDSPELKAMLRAGLNTVMEFDAWYQLLKSLGGHSLYWR